MRLYAKLCAGLVITAVAVSVVLACWYQRDRTQMLESMCKIGLPNFSRPSSVSPETLGCVILSKKRRYSGFIETGFEHSFLISDDLPPTGGRHPDEQRIRPEGSDGAKDSERQNRDGRRHRRGAENR